MHPPLSPCRIPWCQATRNGVWALSKKVILQECRNWHVFFATPVLKRPREMRKEKHDTVQLPGGDSKWAAGWLEVGTSHHLKWLPHYRTCPVFRWTTDSYRKIAPLIWVEKKNQKIWYWLFKGRKKHPKIVLCAMPIWQLEQKAIDWFNCVAWKFLFYCSVFFFKQSYQPQGAGGIGWARCSCI